MFTEEIEDLKNRYLSRLTLHMVFSQEATDLPLYNGRLGRDKIGEFLGTLVDAGDIDHAFVCGPHGVNDEAEAALLAAGVAPERIHIERFGIPDEAGPGRAAVQPPREGDAADARDHDRPRRRQPRHRLPRRAGQHPRRRRGRRARGAVLVQVGRLLHLPRQAARGRGADGAQLRAREARGRRRLRADLPVASAHRARRPLVRRAHELVARCRAREPQSPGYELQRETILARAAELFARRGYTATSMNEVAEACGVSKPSLYHYVRDKHQLLAEIAEAHVARLLALVAEVDAADAGARGSGCAA